ncbi:DEAD/DEAH box helicase [Streptococcus ovuberis]|uniref:DEAD/DEAH box helicase family protein n=1 Tax=Streptococcus ovuberis TaxID=1936207 RepID=A0A7X6MXJ7_9STRE|nr:DEAD/DEAH box helicase [Streptococcus ovuberis]NKZ19761.1 DEAD/DEAH box helicase family protein [Streptococcus ovuberis]
MSRLMPGHIRHQGISLYEAQAITDILVQKDKILASVEGCRLQFSFDDSEVFCDCSLFGQKGFCAHLAAIEYYLKNDIKGESVVHQLQEGWVAQVQEHRQRSKASLFLDELVDDSVGNGISYQLSAEGKFHPTDRQILWTLKILRLPDTRSYIIRDIKSFLKYLDSGQSYQLGKNYYEPLRLLQFDLPSQEVLAFLKRLVPDAVGFDSDFILPYMGRYLKLPQGFFEEGTSLLKALSDFSLELEEGPYETVDFLDLDGEADLFAFRVTVEQTFIRLIMTEKSYQSFFDGNYLFEGGRFYQLDFRQRKLLKAFSQLEGDTRSEKVLQFEFEDKDRLSLLLRDLRSMGCVEAPKQFKIYDFRAFFEFTLQAGDWVELALALDFERIWVSHPADLEKLPFSIDYQHLRTIWSLLEQHGFKPGFKSRKHLAHSQDFYDFYTVVLPAFEDLGEVILAENVRDVFRQSKAQIHLDLTGSLLDIQFDLQGVGQEELQFAHQALQAGQAFYRSRTGKVILFDEETKQINHTLRDLRAQFQPSGRLKVSKLAAFQLSQSLADIKGVYLSDKVSALIEHLRYPEQFPIDEPPIQANLRDYQLLGVKWMKMLAHYGLGGILADDMGLGKTLQTIAFLASHLKKGQRALVLAPSSLIYNWQDEFQRFAPQLDVAVSYGSKAQRLALLEEDHQIVVTSYASFRQDFEVFQDQLIDCLILDEAQVMKNDQTKIASHLRKFETKICFALSGTPIENRLAELWSIFQIVLPGLLPGKRAFNQLTGRQVARLIQPFVLRRRKEEVLTELPDLIEMNWSNELTADQKAIYLAQLQQLRTDIAASSDQEINQRKIEILSAITRLRQICNTPKLFLSDYQGDSGKLESLRQLLAQIQSGGQRVLIFSQFRGMLTLIEQELNRLGLTSYTITGSTKANDRQEITRAFNAGSRDAVLISLKAGGVGINLTGADTVILVDLWWNPAVEDQAISRAYRMGQKRNVECYRLITRGTIEEKIQLLQDSKRELITTVLDGQGGSGSLSAEDIREILGLSSQ